MSERRDDTTETGEHDAPAEREREPRSYYYDDATNYEIYDPARDEDEPDEGGPQGAADEV